VYSHSLQSLKKEGGGGVADLRGARNEKEKKKIICRKKSTETKHLDDPPTEIEGWLITAKKKKEVKERKRPMEIKGRHIQKRSFNGNPFVGKEKKAFWGMVGKRDLQEKRRFTQNTGKEQTRKSYEEEKS